MPIRMARKWAAIGRALLDGSFAREVATASSARTAAIPVWISSRARPDLTVVSDLRLKAHYLKAVFAASKRWSQAAA